MSFGPEADISTLDMNSCRSTVVDIGGSFEFVALSANEVCQTLSTEYPSSA